MGSLRVASIAVTLCTLLATYLTAAPQFSDWSEPVNLGLVINTSFNEGGPAVSKDGRSLYFASNRPGQLGGNDIYVSQWDDATNWWGPPVNIGPMVNTTATEFLPSLSRDGHLLFFQSNRPGSFPGLDIWVSYRENVHDDFAWELPMNLGPGVNAPGLDTGASFFENDDVGVPQLFFASNRGVPGANDIYVSDLLPDGTFGPAVLVPELNSPQPEPGVSVRFDGLEAFLFSARPGGQGAGFDIWTSTRETVFHPWSAPTNLGPEVNTEFNENDPHIASDRRSLYFTSNRTGGMGGADLYVATRLKR